jgi:hypothetical protein
VTISKWGVGKDGQGLSTTPRVEDGPVGGCNAVLVGGGKTGEGYRVHPDFPTRQCPVKKDDCGLTYTHHRLVCDDPGVTASRPFRMTYRCPI